MHIDTSALADSSIDRIQFSSKNLSHREPEVAEFCRSRRVEESGARWSFGAEFSKGTDVFQHRPASSARCLSSGQKREDFWV